VVSGQLKNFHWLLATGYWLLVPEARMTDTFERSAGRLDAVAYELELAGRHAQTAAERFREEEPAQAAAHAFAARGHLYQAIRLLDDAAFAFAQRSTPEATEGEPRDTAD
jgi:hypothetical protein